MTEWAGARPFPDVLVSAQAGDEVAFATLWRWLHPALLRWLRVVAPGNAEDVASEVWISVVRGLDSFEGGEPEFRGWVFTVARRRTIDWTRHRARQPNVAPFGGLDVPQPTIGPDPIDASTALDEALTLLRRLTAEQREVVALRVIAGMTVRETAAIVNKTEGAVRVLCHRGLRALAEQLAAERLTDGVTR
jgi:RNA polymerase sigma-70 factor, ECF subfamily